MNYFSQVTLINDGYQSLNKEWKQQWCYDYIDLLTLAMIDDKHVRVFTDDHKLISQDCRHLTKAGARWYVKVLDWQDIFEREYICNKDNYL